MRTRIVERLSGLGSATGDRTENLPVRYRLTVEQEMLPAGVDEVPGLMRTTGFIDLPFPDMHLLFSDDNLLLTLEDGRQASFFVKSTSTGKIIVSGGLRDP